MQNNVLVVGAGPAGASAAFFLKFLDHENKFNVELVELREINEYIKYHRMCGEAISTKCFEEIKPLKPKGIIEKIQYIEDIYPENTKIKVKANGYIVNRSIFLLDIINKFKKVGGIFRTDRVTNFSKDKKPIVKFGKGEKREYDYVIAADGASSSIANKLGASSGEIRKFIQYIVKKESKHDTLQFFYKEKYHGDYKWVFPNGETSKIGFPFTGSFPKIEDDLGVVEKQGRIVRTGLLEKIVFGRVLLVGDSACQINPLTKGGIRPAMNAGRIVAEAILSNKPRYYETNWKRTKFASGIFNKAFTHLKRMNDKELYNLGCMIESGRTTAKFKDICNAIELSEECGW